MSFPPDIARLYAIASTVGGGKSLKLSGTLLSIRSAMVTNQGPGGCAVLSLALTLPDEYHGGKKDCDCARCQTGRAINRRNAATVVNLIADGSCPEAHLILDSSFASGECFHVKLRHTVYGATSVGTGVNFTHAVANAANDALKP